MVPGFRIFIGVVGVLMMLAGLGVLATVSGAERLTGLWLIVVGAGAVVAVAFERMRYRSEAAERSGDPAGDGAFDSAPLDARFRPTDERFVDPTTRRQLRVWVDPASGERRYRADE